MSEESAQPVSPEPNAVPTVENGGDTPASESQQQFRIFYWGALAIVILNCAAAFSLNLVDPDLWGHITYGREVLQSGELPEAATHTFTAEGYRWINHENIAELVMTYVYDHFGSIALLMGKCALGMSILVVMALCARRHRVDRLVLWSFFFLVATNLTAFFPIRPQLASFACLTAMLFLLHKAFPHGRVTSRPRFGWLWCVPAVMLIWVNSHGGFVAGFAILGTYLVGRSVELYLRKGPDAWATIGRMMFIGVAAGLTVFINPYSVRLAEWLLQSLGSPRPEITEWAPPTPGEPVFIPFVLLVSLLVLVVACDRRKRDWTQIAILALVGWQAAMHLRHISFFAILCGFWMPPMFAGLISRLKSGPRHSGTEIVLSPLMRRATIGAMVVIFGMKGYALAHNLTHLPVPHDRYPVEAVRFMKEQDIEGRLVVNFNWAQYAIASLSPEVQVQFDGRFRTCYPQEIVDMHFDFIVGEHRGLRHRSDISGPINPTRALEYAEPQLVLLDREYEHAVTTMQQYVDEHPGTWTLIYQDGLAELWGRADRYADPASDQFIPEEERVRTDETPSGETPWPAIPSDNK